MRTRPGQLKAPSPDPNQRPGTYINGSNRTRLHELQSVNHGGIGNLSSSSFSLLRGQLSSGRSYAKRYTSSISGAVDSSNIGYKLLKKHGWKEGTGLGIYKQGRLEPVETYVKNNKQGFGFIQIWNVNPNGCKEEKPPKRTKELSKKMRRIQELERRLQEKEFERAFFREFWPDNV